MSTAESVAAKEDSPHAILEVPAHVALLQQALSLAGSHKEGAADALWAGRLKMAARAVSLAAAVLAAAVRKKDLLVLLRVGGQGSPECADQQRWAGAARTRVRVRGGRGSHLLVRVRVAGHASLSFSERPGCAGAARLHARLQRGLQMRMRAAPFARAVVLQANSQREGVKWALSAALGWGAPGLGEAALEGEVDARHAVLGAGGGARGSKRLGGRRNALFSADGAFAYSQSYWRRLVQRK